MPDIRWRITYGDRSWIVNYIVGQRLEKLLNRRLTTPEPFEFEARSDDPTEPVDQITITVPSLGGIILERIAY